LRALNLQDDDPVGRELETARQRALRAGLASIAEEQTAVAEAVRQELTTHLAPPARQSASAAGDATRSAHTEIHGRAIEAARQAVLAMRTTDEIGDDAFHLMEEELDWLEMADRRDEIS
jgi:CPA1 family monovalent cation:H+ antiporter